MIYKLLVSGESVLVWLGALLASTVAARLIQHIANDRARALMGRLWTEVAAAVAEVFQTYVSAIKDGSADGTLTDAEKQHAKELALAKLKENLGSKGLGRLERILGVESMDKYLENKIEAEVHRFKQIQPAQPGTVSTPAVPATTGGAAPLAQPPQAA